MADLRFWRKNNELERGITFQGLSLDDLASYFTFNSHQYPLVGLNQTIHGDREEVDAHFAGLVTGGYYSNGVIFACELSRFLLFSEARFQFRQFRQGRPGNLFGGRELEILETPEPGKTTGDLLARAILDADFAGNYFAARRGTRIKRMRPDWVDIILGSEYSDEEAGDLDAEVVGYVYWPGGRNSGRDPLTLLREEVCHFAPIPDPMACYRGMSWLTPIIREVLADKAMTSHRLRFFENGATPNMVVKTEIQDPQKFEMWVEKFKANHESIANAYKTLFLAQGADATVVGSQFKQIDFKVVQGAGETRIAAAAGVPPIIVGLSEGLESATYSNYGQAKRRFADGTMRPLWRNMAGSLATIIDVPARSELWYDDRDIAFLREDEKDAAEIQQTQAIAIKSLVDAGFEAASVVDAVTAGDLTRLSHSGLFSVQLQPAGSENGSGNGKVELPAGASVE